MIEIIYIQHINPNEKLTGVLADENVRLLKQVVNSQVFSVIHLSDTERQVASLIKIQHPRAGLIFAPYDQKHDHNARVAQYIKQENPHAKVVLMLHPSDIPVRENDFGLDGMIKMVLFTDRHYLRQVLEKQLPNLR